MRLDDLQQEIYRPESEIDKRKHEESRYDPSAVDKHAKVEELKVERKWTKSFDEFWRSRKVIMVSSIVVGVIFLLSIVMAFNTFYQKKSFNVDNVSVTIEGPNEVNSDQTVEYKLIYKNDNRASLRKAFILVNHSEYFRPEGSGQFKVENTTNGRIDIGEIEAFSKGEIVIRGKYFAPAFSLAYVNLRMEYYPSIINSPFQLENKIGTNVRTSPLDIEVNAPTESIVGGEVDYSIDYKNLVPSTFNNVQLRVDYPQDFEFVSADPAPDSGNNSWLIGNLVSGQGGQVKIRGRMNGAEGSAKVLRANLGLMNEDGKFVVYGEEERLIKITKSQLYIRQETGVKSVEQGQKINYSIEYGNNGEIGIRDAIITVEIDSKVIDYSSIDTVKGHYDDSRKTITWKAADYPQLANLAPGARGSFQFVLNVVNFVKVEKKEDKNYSVRTVAKIDSPDIPTPIGSNKVIPSNQLDLKLQSKITFETLGYYQDANIENFGPLPPVVGQETSYVMHWQISSVSNDLSDVRVVSALPTGVSWKGKIYPNDSQITFNERTNEIVWNVGKVENGAGILSPKKEVSFQISLSPQINQVGSPALILKTSRLTGKDSFEGGDFQIDYRQKDTSLDEDPKVLSAGGRVIAATQ